MSPEPVRDGPDAERMVASLRPHGRALFWPSLLLIGTAGVVAYFAGNLPEPWMNAALIVAGILFAIIAWVLPLLSWLNRRYVITTRRIVLRRGLVVRSRQELLHSRGYDITVRKNALQSMVGSGDVLINTGLDRPIVLRDVPMADLVQGSLHDLMERSLNPIAARRQAEQSAATGDSRAWGLR